MPQAKSDPLRELARSHGIELSYRDMSGARREASLESVLLVLRALGEPVSRPRDAGAVLAERRRRLELRPIEPVHIAWDGRIPPIAFRLPSRRTTREVHLRIAFEGGEVEETVEKPVGIGARRALARVLVRRRLPPGYHRVSVEVGSFRMETLVIASPLRAPSPRERAWGVFLPLHALRSSRSAGAGSFGDLAVLAEWAVARGAASVGVLPLLAAFLDEPFEPSPYTPVSRIFWNELHLDPDLLEEARTSDELRAVRRSREFRRELEQLRALPHVDHRRQMALLRKLLEPAARAFHEKAPPGRRERFEAFLAETPRAADYARFRAACEKKGSTWESWPARARDGSLSARDYDEGAFRYHQYVQWAAAEQLARASSVGASASGGGTKRPLYLDFPLGVHRGGYDVWRWRSSFVLDVSGGCPPDPVFTRGQDWGFPPLHPERLRDAGYEYLIEALRAHFRHAGLLRIDHAMGLERLYWVPRGLDGRSGVYVRYPREELCAVLVLEASRAGAAVVGEDLGTVPLAVRRAMKRHGLHRMHVTQLEARPDPRVALPAAEPDMAASLNTHDMPPFAGFWRGLDIEDRKELGLIDARSAAEERAIREDLKRSLGLFLRDRPFRNVREALLACLEAMARGPAWLLGVNLEDLWGEEEPQNLPGTGLERPNWTRKARLSLEEIRESRAVGRILHRISRWRLQPENPEHRGG